MTDEPRGVDRSRPSARSQCATRSRRSVLLGTAGLLGGLAGCLSGSSPGADSPGPSPGTTTPSTASSTATATTETTTTATTTSTPEPCYASTPSVDVEVPEKPDELTADAARSLVVEFEKAYKHANLAATYDLARYSAHVVDRRTNAEPIDDGYRVQVKVHSDWATSGNESESPITASGGYQHGYRVTDRRFVREGTTLACWGEG